MSKVRTQSSEFSTPNRGEPKPHNMVEEPLATSKTKTRDMLEFLVKKVESLESRVPAVPMVPIPPVTADRSSLEALPLNFVCKTFNLSNLSSMTLQSGSVLLRSLFSLVTLGSALPRVR